MPSFETKHNANLPNTLPNSCPIVNFIERDEDGVAVVYDVKNAPKKLFVKIANSIYQQGLSLRTLEFYCQLVYLIYSEPNTRLSILKIQSRINYYTAKNPNKDTINQYLKTLISIGLIIRVGKFLYAPSNPPLPRRCRETTEVAPITSKLNDDYETSNTSNWCNLLETNRIKEECIHHNIYQEPKNNYTPFYITAYNNDTVSCTLALELYLASHPYNRHRPSKVCKDLNISRKTYYKYLRELVQKKIVNKIQLTYNCNHYINHNRIRLQEESMEIKSGRYYYRKEEWKQKAKTKTAHSRLWYASPMGRIMQEYKINYIPAFDNYDPYNAYKIVKTLFEQYGYNIKAPLIVRGILDDYNWIKIVDREHAKFKREQARERMYQSTPESFLDYMQS
jgi:hypothetical protein